MIFSANTSAPAFIGAPGRDPVRSTLAVAVVACLIAAPIAGCATNRAPRQIDDNPFASGPVSWNWGRVMEITPAAEIVVSTQGSQRARYFVSATESALIVLNLANPELPTAFARVLRDMAVHHPEYFRTKDTAGTLVQDKVRFGRDGLFVANRKIADHDQVVETFSRSEVKEIWGAVVARGSLPGTALGGWIGFAIGVVPGLGGSSEGAAWAVSIASAAVGASLGFRWSTHQTEGLIYRTP
jgi:hypothetical protein